MFSLEIHETNVEEEPDENVIFRHTFIKSTHWWRKSVINEQNRQLITTRRGDVAYLMAVMAGETARRADTSGPTGNARQAREYGLPLHVPTRIRALLALIASQNQIGFLGFQIKPGTSPISSKKPQIPLTKENRTGFLRAKHTSSSASSSSMYSSIVTVCSASSSKASAIPSPDRGTLDSGGLELGLGFLVSGRAPKGSRSRHGEERRGEDGRARGFFS